MVLEATMIIVDNSESSRNGDYIPSRWEAQSDAVNMIFSAKTQANPESSVGLMNMGGSGPQMLVTLTADFGKILDGLHRTKIHGRTHLATAIQVAGLALKHRQNKSQRQRIIVFTCSPIYEDEKSLIKLGKKMKKNNVSIDLVAFGDLDPLVTQKLELFNNSVKGGDGSHFEVIHPGASLLSDSLISTPILAGDGAVPRNTGGEGSGTAGNSSGFEFGVDPSTDPELALALRMSMEEANARQEKSQPKEESTMSNIPEEPMETEPLLKEDGQTTVVGNSMDQKEGQGKKDKDDQNEDSDEKMDIS